MGMFSPSFFSRHKKLVVGAHGQIKWAKKAQTYPHYDVTNKKTQIQNFPIFLNRRFTSFRIFGGFEQFSISICWRVMAEYVGAILRQNFGARWT